MSMEGNKMKKEWRKHEKGYYLPKQKPEKIEMPTFKFITICGAVNPNSEAFGKYIEALYGIAYGIRMSYKWDIPPKDYYEYTVYPLEGVWDLIDLTLYKEETVDKDNLKFELMIRQPEFVDDALFKLVAETAMKKKANELIARVEFKTISDGPCIQMMHIGPFENEAATFKEMEVYCHEIGHERHSKTHREIYISDPRKVAPEKLKTVLRFKIK